MDICSSILAQCKDIIYKLLRSFTSPVAVSKPVTCVYLHLQTNIHTLKQNHSGMTVIRFWVIRYLYFLTSIICPNENIRSTPSELVVVLNTYSFLTSLKRLIPKCIIPIEKVRLSDLNNKEFMSNDEFAFIHLGIQQS